MFSALFDRRAENKNLALFLQVIPDLKICVEADYLNDIDFNIGNATFVATLHIFKIAMKPVVMLTLNKKYF